jgi:hypothetical protein
MNNSLAERILVEIMGWDQEQISIERPLIQALGNLKFDEYQQFSTGMRFTESLVNWLNQFQTIGERNIAYKFIKSHLIFITSEQINHLINICFPERINIKLTLKAAEILKIPPYLVTKIHNSDIYQQVKRKALFLGLSDGAKIDQLRRSANLDNEQVFSSYYISEEKIHDLIRELKEALKQEAKFSSIFLIDDFTASGLSYLRLAEGKGKLLNFLNKVFETKKEEQTVLSDLIELENLDIHIIFYLATRKALNHLESGIEAWKQEQKKKFNHSVTAVQVIEELTSDTVKEDKDFIQIIKRGNYFDEKIIDKHYKKGKIKEPYLGFDECALPVVLNHNTPNNSLPILWFPPDMKITGLFPRITRHKE